MVIGDFIRKARKKLGMTQAELAICCDVSKSYISMIEKGKSNTTIDVLKAISEVLRVPYSVLELLSTDLGELEGTTKLLFREIQDKAYKHYFGMDWTRRTGQTTRLADMYIQKLFMEGHIHVVDHHATEGSNDWLFKIICNRLKLEHSHVLQELNMDRLSLEISFK